MTLEAFRLFVEEQVRSLGAQNLVFTRKPTLIEVSLEKAGRSKEAPYSEASELLGKTDPLFERAWASHLRQLETCQLVLEALENPLIIEAKEIFARSEEAIKALGAASLVVACGGDEYVKSVIRLCSSESHVLPINSDPKTSRGVCALVLNDFIRWQEGQTALPAVTWKVIEARSGGEVVGRAVDTVFVGNARQLTRTTLSASMESASTSDSSDSGMQWDANYLLLYPGLGSTGWALSAVQHVCPPAMDSSVDVAALDFYVSQPYQGGESSVLKLPSQRLTRPGSIEIQSLMTDGGMCAFGNNVIPLDRGDKVKVDFGLGISSRVSTYTADSHYCRTFFITSDGESLAHDSDLYSSSLYIGNESKLFMSRYVVRLYDQEGVLIIEEEQKSSGVFLIAPGFAPQWYGQTCFACDISMREGFIFKPSAERFDLLIVGNVPSSGPASKSHWVIDNPDRVLIINSKNPCTVAFDSYYQVEVQGEIEFQLGSEGVPVFGLPTL
jgi:hypothetical protein